MRYAYLPYKTTPSLSRTCRRVDKRSASTNISAHRQHQRDQQHAPVETEQIEGEAEEIHFLSQSCSAYYYFVCLAMPCAKDLISATAGTHANWLSQ